MVEPWYRDTLAADRHRLAEIDALIGGGEYRPGDPGWETGQALANAAFKDPDCLRGFIRVAMVLSRASDVTAQPGLLDKVIALGAGWRDEPLPAPSRSELLSIAGGGRSRSMRVEAGEAGIEYDVTGAGRPVILLHGFPDSGRLWRNQVPVLAGAGFRVIVPDLRGYGRSDKPGTADSYSFSSLIGDVMAVLSDAGAERAHVVGHDWGAALGWVFASLVPDRVDHLAVLSVGHPSTFRRTLEQHQKSWYMLLFQFAGVAEQWLSDNNWANFRSWAHHPDSEAVITELEATKSLTPALNWYRANVPPESWVAPPLALPPVQAPTMGIWSSGDIALTETQMTDSAQNVTGPWRYERIEGPGHWMQLEAPDTINQLLLDFLPR